MGVYLSAPSVAHSSGLEPIPHSPMKKFRNGLPAWLAENVPVVGQSFGTERLGLALTVRLPTPSKWPRHRSRPGAPASAGTQSRFFAPVRGVSPPERRLSEGAPSASCPARSVCPELRRTVSTIPSRSAGKSTSTCPSNGAIFAVSQASCWPAGKTHHMPRMWNPHSAADSGSHKVRPLCEKQPRSG